MAACSGGGAGAGYIGQSINPEPSDQTDLKDSVDAILKAVENQCTQEGLPGGPRGLGGLQVGSGSPTYQPPALCFGDVASRVLWNLLE